MDKRAIGAKMTKLHHVGDKTINEQYLKKSKSMKNNKTSVSESTVQDFCGSLLGATCSLSLTRRLELHKSTNPPGMRNASVLLLPFSVLLCYQIGDVLALTCLFSRL